MLHLLPVLLLTEPEMLGRNRGSAWWPLCMPAGVYLAVRQGAALLSGCLN